MVTVTFTSNLRRHVESTPLSVAGATVGEVLDAVFAARPVLRSYVLDDRGEVRKHVVIFVGGQAIRDRLGLTDLVPEGAEVHVMQALSGG